MGIRSVVVALVLSALVLSAVAGCGPARTDRSAATATTPLSVLHRWDAARARAWADGDPVRLGALYVPGSSAGRRDLALLAAYRRRGLRVRGMQMQVLAVRVLTARATTLTVEVVERFAGAEVRAGGEVRRLPSGQPVRRLIELRRHDDQWRVGEVRQLPPPARR